MVKIILLVVVLTFSQCALSTKKDKDWCEKMNQKSADYIYNFQMSDNSAYLDSALVCVDKSLKECGEFKQILSFRKLDILSKKYDYQEAISFIKSFDNPLFKDLPYYNNYLLNRYKAMSQQFNGDIEKRDYYLKITIGDLEQFILQNEEEIDLMFNLTDVNDILGNPLHFVIPQYYYSKSILYGYDSVKIELDSLQKLKGGNSEYYDFILVCLENDFMDFVGY